MYIVAGERQQMRENLLRKKSKPHMCLTKVSNLKLLEFRSREKRWIMFLIKSWGLNQIQRHSILWGQNLKSGWIKPLLGMRLFCWLKDWAYDINLISVLLYVDVSILLSGSRTFLTQLNSFFLLDLLTCRNH